MTSFFDASCTTCDHRFGWTGELSDKPACPKCGKYDKPPQSDIQQLEDFKRLLAVGLKELTPELLGEMQKQSGLSFGQLAGKLGIPVSTVKRAIFGEVAISRDVKQRWMAICGFGGDE